MTDQFKEVAQSSLHLHPLRLAENGLIITGNGGNVIHMDEGVARLLGFTAEEKMESDQLVGRIKFAEGATFEKVVESAMKNGAWRGEAAGVSMDNLAVLLDVEVRRIGAGKGEAAAVVVVRDATRVRKMEKQVLESQQMELVEKMTRGIVHEFRNLLTVISAHAELIRMTADSPPDEETERIVQTCERATDLTRRLSDITRRPRPDTQDLEVGEVLGEICAMVAKALPPQVSIAASDASGLPVIRADRSTLIRAMIHLCLNAGEAMPEGGKVTLDASHIGVSPDDITAHPARDPGAYVVLAVTDQGHGMSPSSRHHLFEPFFTTKKNGTGLGLYSARQAIIGMGGELGVYTEPGYGTCIKIFLPVAAPAGGAADLSDATVSGGPRTVLVVDDATDVRQAAVRMLERAGHKVLTASDGEEAVELFEKRAKEIDVVLLDVVMPDVGGEGVHREVVRIRPGVGLVVMSGFPRQAAEQILGVDMPHFVAKPFTRAALLQVVAAAAASDSR